MTRKIVTMTGLAEMVGRHRNMVYRYRLQPDYVDEDGRGYYSLKTAEKLAEKVREYQPGKGRRMKLRGLKRKPKGK